MAALACVVRRTQSAYPAFLRSTNPSDLTFPTAVYGLTSRTSGYDPVILEEDRRPPARRERRDIRHGQQRAPACGWQGIHSAQIGSGQLRTGGTYRQHQRPGTSIRIASRSPRADGRSVAPRRDARRRPSPDSGSALHPGAVLNMAFYTNAKEKSAPGPERRPVPAASAHSDWPSKSSASGEYNNAVIQDDVDAGSNFTLFTPAVSRRRWCVARSRPPPPVSPVHGSRDCRPSKASSKKLNPLLASHVYVSSVDQAKVERAIKPASIAFGVFGSSPRSPHC